jgi:hypothetical protein
MIKGANTHLAMLILIISSAECVLFWGIASSVIQLTEAAGAHLLTICISAGASLSLQPNIRRTTLWRLAVFGALFLGPLGPLFAAIISLVNGKENLEKTTENRSIRQDLPHMDQKALDALTSYFGTEPSAQKDASEPEISDDANQPTPAEVFANSSAAYGRLVDQFEQRVVENRSDFNTQLALARIHVSQAKHPSISQLERKTAIQNAYRQLENCAKINPYRHDVEVDICELMYREERFRDAAVGIRSVIDADGASAQPWALRAVTIYLDSLLAANETDALRRDAERLLSWPQVYNNTDLRGALELWRRNHASEPPVAAPNER